MNTLPPLTENDIRARASQQSWVRGQEYFESSSVSAAVWRGSQLTAEVQGSEYAPYLVQVQFDGQAIHHAVCTCPYNWGGDCKHIVAALLFLLHEPGQIEQRPPLPDLLAPLDREQLAKIVIHLAEDFPAIIDSLENLATRVAPSKAPSPAPSSQPPIDIKLLQRRIKAELRTSIHTGYEWGDDFYDSDLSAALEPALDKARTFLHAGDPRSALAILEAATNAWEDGIDSLDEYVREAFEDSADDFTQPLGELWAETLLSTDLTPGERDHWVEMLDDFCDSIYGGGSLEIALEAVQQGWDYPPLVAVLHGEITEKGAREGEPSDYADFLAEIRLRILERRGQYQEYLYLAEAEGQLMRYLHMLIRLGETDKAIEKAIENLLHPEDIHALATTLAEHGPLEKAFSLARHGLALESKQGKAALAEWLRDQAHSHRQAELALWAAQRALAEKANLPNYRALQQIAGSQWEELKPGALEIMRNSPSAESKVDVYLHEKMYLQAIETVDRASWFHNINPVIEAVKTEYPEWAFRQCSKQADQIMDAGRAKDYAIAADWLRRGRDILLAAGQQPHWAAHLSALMETHQRKYKLMPMLKKLLT